MKKNFRDSLDDLDKQLFDAAMSAKRWNRRTDEFEDISPEEKMQVFKDFKKIVDEVSGDSK